MQRIAEPTDHLGAVAIAIGVTGATALLMLFARYLPQVGPFKRMTLATTAGGTLAETPAALSAAAVRPGDEGIARSGGVRHGHR